MNGLYYRAVHYSNDSEEGEKKNKKSFKKIWCELKKYYFYTTKQTKLKNYGNNNIKPYQDKEIVLG